MPSNELQSYLIRFRAQVGEMESGIRKVKTEVSGLSTHVKSAGKTMAVALAGAFTGLQAISFLKDAGRQALEFGGRMTEVSTLLKDTSGVKSLREEMLKLSAEFGKVPVDEARGLYDVISAGFVNAADAAEIMRGANVLAVAGITDVKNASSGLIASLNAWKSAGLSVAEANDAMFVAMRAGVTTIGDLSSNIGQVASIAAQAKISFDEIMAATAALTLGGVSTSEAMTRIRSTLVAVVKQEKEAVDSVNQMNRVLREQGREAIDFSIKGLGEQGLVGFMRQLRDATDGNLQTLGKMFGRVEALAGVASLAGNQFEDFVAILESMKTKSGEAAAALAKVMEDPEQRLAIAKAKFQVFSIEIGDALVKGAVPAMEALVNNLDLVVASAKTLAVVIASQAAKALILWILQVRASIVEMVRYQIALAQMSGLTAAAARGQVALATAAGIARAAIAGLGGPISALIIALGIAATAWQVYTGRQAAAAAGAESAAQRLAKEARALSKLGEDVQIAKMKELEEGIRDLEDRLRSLRQEREKVSRGFAEGMGEASFGVMAATDAMVAQIDDGIAKTLADLVLLKDAHNALADAIRRKQEEAADKEGTSLVIPEWDDVKAAGEKTLAGLEGFYKEQLATLEASHDAGMVSETDYWEQRRELISNFGRRETEILRSLAAQAPTPKERMEIEADLLKKQSERRVEAIRIMYAEVEARRRLDLARAEGTKELAQIDVEGQVARMTAAFSAGSVTVREYYDARIQLARHAAKAELDLLYIQAAAAKSDEDREKILNRAAAVSRRLAQDEATLQEQRTAASTQARLEAGRIAADYAQMRVAQGGTVIDQLKLQQEAELAQIDARNAEELERYRTLAADKIKLGEEYFSKEEALDRIRAAQAIEREKTLADQRRTVQLAAINQLQTVFGGAADMFGQLYEASGKKSKEFFYFQKAMSIAQAIANTAEGVTKALAQGGIFGLAMAAIITATGAAQIATIAAQKPPAGFLRGGLITQGRGGVDDVHIVAARDEYVHPAQAVRYYGVQAMEAIRRMVVPREVFAGLGTFHVQAPRMAYEAGGLVTPQQGGKSVSSSLVINVRDPRLEAELRREVEPIVIRILKEHS